MPSRRIAIVALIISVGVYAGVGLAKQQAHRVLAEGAQPGIGRSLAEFVAAI